MTALRWFTIAAFSLIASSIADAASIARFLLKGSGIEGSPFLEPLLGSVGVVGLTPAKFLGLMTLL